jgi:hypothetical protein
VVVSTDAPEGLMPRPVNRSDSRSIRRVTARTSPSGPAWGCRGDAGA